MPETASEKANKNETALLLVSRQIGLTYSSEETDGIRGFNVSYGKPVFKKGSIVFFFKTGFHSGSANKHDSLGLPYIKLFEPGIGTRFLHYPYEKTGERLGYAFGFELLLSGLRGEVYEQKGETLEGRMKKWFFIPEVNLYPIAGSMEVSKNLRFSLLFGYGWAPRNLIIRQGNIRKDLYSQTAIEVSYHY